MSGEHHRGFCEGPSPALSFCQVNTCLLNKEKEKKTLKESVERSRGNKTTTKNPPLMLKCSTNKYSHSNQHCAPMDRFERVPSMAWSDLACMHALEKEMATHSSTLAWKIPWTEEPGRLQSMGSRRVGHDWATSLSLFTFMHWRRKWQPTPVFLPGESQGPGSLVGCRLWGCRVGRDWSDLAAVASTR